MHIFGLIQRIKNRSCDIAHTLSNDPCYRRCRYRINKWFEGYKHTQPHAYKTERFDIRMLFEFYKTDYQNRTDSSPNSLVREELLVLEANMILQYANRLQHDPIYAIVPSILNDASSNDKA